MVKHGLAVLLVAASAHAQSPMQLQMASMAQTFAPGQVAASPLYDGYFGHRQPVSNVVNMEAGRCYTILGVGGPGVVDLDLFLFDPANRRVAADLRYDNTPHIYYCASWPGAYRVEAKVKRGAGPAAVQAFTAAGPQAVPPPVAAPPQVVDDEDELGERVDAQAAIVVPGARRVGEIFRGVAMRENDHSDWYVTLEGGRCYTFVGGGGPGITGLYLYLWGPNGRRVADRRSDTTDTQLAYCTPIPGPYHLQAKAGRGAGEYRVGVYLR
jgi:hypothetical protein